MYLTEFPHGVGIQEEGFGDNMRISPNLREANHAGAKYDLYRNYFLKDQMRISVSRRLEHQWRLGPKGLSLVRRKDGADVPDIR